MSSEAQTGERWKETGAITLQSKLAAYKGKRANPRESIKMAGMCLILSE